MLKITKTYIKDLLITDGKQHNDNRGYLRELTSEKEIGNKFKFTIVSKSKKNVLRGLHFQKKKPQGKYLSVLKGEIFDVALDCRPMSKTFGKHFKILLSDKNNKSIFIPPGFAHGFLCLKEENIIVYSCTNYRDKKSEAGIQWNDPSLKIKWPIKKPILSLKDKNNLSFNFYFN